MPEQVATKAVAVHAKAVELGKDVLRMTTRAGSGHPSSALAIAHIVVDLMYREMRWDPANPWNRASDRLVLSIGHAVPIIYAAYADLGGAVGRSRKTAKKLTRDDLNSLRQLESYLDGHPNPAEGFPFFDAATGSLGQGLSVAAGLAVAARLDGLDKRIFCIVGDGESREGQVFEALDFIVDHDLTNVCAIFSCNGYGQNDVVSPQQSVESTARKLKAFGWEVREVDGHHPDELHEAISLAGTLDKPLAVVATTVKGWGVELMRSSNYHGKPVSAAELDKALAQLDETAGQVGAEDNGLTPQPVPHESRRAVKETVELPSFDDALARVDLAAALDKRELATRVAYGAALVALGDVDDRIVALDGDVGNSTFANFFANHHADRFVECKIAEQNMITVAAGLAATGKIPFASSFAKFIARACDQIDMAAISRANIKIVGSHSGISLGADGPSQMSVSDVAYFRSLTRVDNGKGDVACHVFQPADAVCAYRCCELMANIDGLCYLRTHRPTAPFLYPTDQEFELRGSKQLRGGDHITLVSAGYMLHTVLEAADQLNKDGLHANVFDAYTLPLDAAPILQSARESGGMIVTIEDNYIGGLHAELAEAAAEAGDVRVIGMTPLRIPKSAQTAADVFSYVGIGLEDIMARVRELVAQGPVTNEE